jgi:Co/Zn/Cd efflux system component
MQKTIFKISKMDCPSEEHLIRMKLADVAEITTLIFDIPNRQLIVFHEDTYDTILQKLDTLNFDTTLVESHQNIQIETSQNNLKQERRLLWQVLSINFFFFILEMITGFISHSMGLIADSLDMLADSTVYGLALLVVGGTTKQKKDIAKWAGLMQGLLAVWGFYEVLKRFVIFEATPHFQSMMIISILALIGNMWCMYLLQKSKSNEAHMKASMIFTSNDILVNLGVISAGGLVYLTQSRYPDLIIGIIVFFLVGKGAITIFKLSK